MDRFYLSNELPSTYRNLMDKLNKDEINKEIIKPLMESLKQLP